MKKKKDFTGKAVSWAVSEIPDGRIIGNKIFAGNAEVVIEACSCSSCSSCDGDDYSVNYSNENITVTVCSERAVVFALLEIAEQIKTKNKKNVKHKFPFKTRNYKHEIKFVENTSRSPISLYTSEFWESFCRELLKRGFNGVVLYADHPHFFQFLLDYKKFPEARMIGRSETGINQLAVNKALGIMKEYGFNTFIQNYITHVTENFARAHGHPSQNEKAGRLSALWTRDVIAYSRYCYREIFRVCPDLTGLYMNFESASNAYDFIEQAVLQVYNKFVNKPVIVIRVWNANIIERAVKIIKEYQGKIIICHKIMDTSDTYYLPAADSRAVEWKKAIGTTEFMFEYGPCHNCATNIKFMLWSDPQFLYTLLNDAKKKGADSISFHSVAEILANHVKGNEVISEEHKALSWMNYFHLDALVRYFKAQEFNEERFIGYYKEHFGLKDIQNKKLYDAMTRSSRIVPLVCRQFHHTSADEGYQIIGRYNFIQEPFFYYPCSFLNAQHKKDIIIGPWIAKKMNYNVCPDNYQRIIDYVDPGKKKSENNPRVISEKLKSYAVESYRTIKNIASSSTDGRFKKMLFYADVNRRIGLSISEEIKAGISFYGCYFSKNKKDFAAKYRSGLSHLELYKKHLDTEKEKVKLIRGFYSDYGEYYYAGRYISALRKVLLKVEANKYPFKAFRTFVSSRREYNEIRRNLRPNAMHTGKTMKKALKHLLTSLKMANNVLELLKGRTEYEYFYENSKIWKNYLEYEIKRVQGVSLKAGSGERGILNVDTAFRYSQPFHSDFDGFFTPYDYIGSDKINFNIDSDKSGLIINVEQYDYSVKELEAKWDSIIGDGPESWFMRMEIDPASNARKVVSLISAPRARFILRQNIDFKSRQHLLCSMSKIEKRIKTEYKKDSYSWTLRFKIPYSVIGRRPKKGEAWGFNLRANTCMKGLKNHTWRANYEMFNFGNQKMLGKLVF